LRCSKQCDRRGSSPSWSIFKAAERKRVPSCPWLASQSRPGSKPDIGARSQQGLAQAAQRWAWQWNSFMANPPVGPGLGSFSASPMHFRWRSEKVAILELEGDRRAEPQRAARTFVTPPFPSVKNHQAWESHRPSVFTMNVRRLAAGLGPIQSYEQPK